MKVEGARSDSELVSTVKKTEVTISKMQAVADGFYLMEFSWPRALGPPLPGQFATIRVTTQTDPLLRRPFAFSNYDEELEVGQLIFQKRGKATGILAALRPEETIEMIGPLGNSFPLPSVGRAPVLVGGGIGIGPILFLADWLRSQGHDPLVVLGFRGANAVPAAALKNRGQHVLCTDDGSLGFEGTTADYLVELPDGRLQESELYACGPQPMLKACHEVAVFSGCPCWVGMEQTMACGVGVCMGCAIPVHGEQRFARVCTEGPVFESREVRWT